MTEGGDDDVGKSRDGGASGGSGAPRLGGLGAFPSAFLDEYPDFFAIAPAERDEVHIIGLRPDIAFVTVTPGPMPLPETLRRPAAKRQDVLDYLARWSTTEVIFVERAAVLRSQSPPFVFRIGETAETSQILAKKPDPAIASLIFTLLMMHPHLWPDVARHLDAERQVRSLPSILPEH